MLKKFDSSYSGFTEDGAKWLVENTDIKLIGEKERAGLFSFKIFSFRSFNYNNLSLFCNKIYVGLHLKFPQTCIL